MSMPSMRFLALSFAGMVLTGCGGAEDAGPDLEVSRMEVLEAEDAMNHAVDGLDCESGLAYMAEAEPIFVASGMVVRSKGELGEVCEQMVAPRTGAVFAIDTRTANMVSDDVAVVVREGTYTINFREQPSVDVDLVMTTVWQRTLDGWKMVHLHESFPATPMTGD